MKFYVKRTSLRGQTANSQPHHLAAQDAEGRWFVSIYTIDELMLFIKSCNNPEGVIVAEDSIEIYDDYRE